MTERDLTNEGELAQECNCLVRNKGGNCVCVSVKKNKRAKEHERSPRISLSSLSLFPPPPPPQIPPILYSVYNTYILSISLLLFQQHFLAAAINFNYFSINLYNIYIARLAIIIIVVQQLDRAFAGLER